MVASDDEPDRKSTEKRNTGYSLQEICVESHQLEVLLGSLALDYYLTERSLPTPILTQIARVLG